MISKITFPKSIFDNSKSCIYVICIDNKKYYVGITGSKNAQGEFISSPFKRLSKHFVYTNSNKTFSIFKNNHEIDLKNSEIDFYYFTFDNLSQKKLNKEDEKKLYKNGEKYLINLFKINYDLVSLNSDLNLNIDKKCFSEEDEKSLVEFFDYITEIQLPF